MRISRRLVAVLFVLDAADTVAWLAGVVPRLSGLPPVTVFVVCLRAIVGSVEGVSAWLLVGDAPTAIALAPVALVGAAVTTTLIVSFALAPSDIPPTARTPTVIAYWTVAIIGLAAVTADRWRPRDGQGPGRRQPRS